MIFHFLLLFLSYFLTSARSASFCSTNVACIEHIKKIVPETNRFWFGDQYKLQCGTGSNARFRAQNSIDCINPRELAGFYNLGSRLFRVKTFASAYLNNLQIFPRIVYKPENGTYRACDHDYNTTFYDGEIHGHPDMEPASPFALSKPPKIVWPELDHNDSLIIAMVDVGFGTLRFLSANFPRDTVVIRKYQVVENYRDGMPTPMALLVFRPPSGVIYTPKAFKNYAYGQFDLTDFMMRHNLERGLIGLNWVMVGSDAYAIEKQRLRGTVDNCHSLVQSKLLKDQRWDFVDSFSLSEMDSSLSASFRQPAFSEDVCCSRIELAADTVFADPLGDKQIPSIAYKNEPVLTSLQSLQQSTDGYQRALRHYIVAKDDRFTIAMLDPKRGVLHWLVADVSAASLATGEPLNDGVVIAPYWPLVPDKPNDCNHIIIMEFRQPRSAATSEIVEHYNQDHPLRSAQCKGDCIYRKSFTIEQFKAFHRLSLSSMTWFKVCYDIYEASVRLRDIQNANFSTSVDSQHKPMEYVKEQRRFAQQQHIDMENICALVHQTDIDCIRLSTASATPRPALPPLAFIMQAFVMSIFIIV